MSGAPLTQSEVRSFLDTWYHALDIHVPLSEALEMVADEDLLFVLPDMTAKGKDDFANLVYKHWTHTFFDEVHETKKCEATINGTEAELKVVTFWQASMWTPPAAKSERIRATAEQTWKVIRSARTGKPVIQQYIVDSFVPEGEVALPAVS